MDDKVRYIHFRAVDPSSDGIMSRGGATVAYSEDESGVTCAGVAYCNPHSDNFNYSLGRAKAAGRLRQTLYNPELLDGEDDKHFLFPTRSHMLNSLTEFMADMGYFTRRAIKRG